MREGAPRGREGRTGSAPRRAALLAMLLGANAASAQPRPTAAELGDLSLEQLGNIVVTSVSRRAESLLSAPASAYVITAQDIRRSGARSLPEALRLAPNLQVARTGASQWAISARGFNNAIGNKLLVLVDGRTIYSPLFSGVFWDAHDLMLEDVERIEVISGPGATLWGANAVNGVINVTTKPASATQGALVAVSAGTVDRQLAARVGSAFGSTGFWRVYAMGIDRRASRRENGTPVPDETTKVQAGWRAEWGAPESRFDVHGDLYEAGSAPGTPEAPRLSGGNIVAAWNRTHADGATSRLQAWWDTSRRDEPFTFRDDMTVMDIEWQHAPAMPEGHRLVWGAGYRQAHDETRASLLTAFVPAERRLRWLNAYAQHEMRLGHSLELTLGAKAERNVYTGWEFLPNVRLAWTPSERRMAWASLSRSVRAPARLDRDFRFPGNPPFFILGGPDFQSEVAKVLELGWREQPTADLSYSATLFHHRYERLRSGQPPPAFVQNMIAGHSSGIEAWAHWQATRGWRLSGGFTHLRQHLRVLPGSTDPTGPSALGNDPRSQWLLRSSFNAGAHEADVTVRHVGALPLPAVPAYTAVDARWGWHVSPAAELSLTVQNLLDQGHVEFGAAPGRAEVRRSAWLKLVWRN